jgi:thiol-disulfide isomerase/thioredoxin
MAYTVIVDGYLPILSPKRGIVKRASLSRILCGLLSLTVFCAVASADTGARAPEFSAQSLDGHTFSNSSLRGRVVLLEFWATWCPYCLSDQAAVNHVARDFSSDGLVVLTVDVGESEKTVRTFLQAHPTSCPVALDEGKKLSARFGKHGLPYYVVIDREGYVAATQNGAAGEDALVSMVSLAGRFLYSGTPRSDMPPRSDGTRSSGRTVTSGDNPIPDSAPVVSPPKVIELPPAPSARRSLPPKPSPKTIFVLANGERLESGEYTMEAGILHVTVGGERRAIALSALDQKATTALNRQRGIDLKIPQSRNEVYVGF